MNYPRSPPLTFCRPKLLQILSRVYIQDSIVCPPPPLCVLMEGKWLAGGWGQQQQGVGVNRQHAGRENLEQFRTTESLTWTSCNTYSLIKPPLSICVYS